MKSKDKGKLRELETVVELVADEPTVEEVPAQTPVMRGPMFLGDWTVDYSVDKGFATITWASEEGIRRVELPGWLFEKIAK